MVNTDTIQFRVATETDAPQIQSLVEAAFQADDIRPNWTADVALNHSFRLPEEVVRSIITDPKGAFLMATNSDGELIGAVAIYRRDEEVARIAHLALEQKYQRSGLGRFILSHAEKHIAETWGVKRIGLNAVSTRLQLIAWYERRGFVKTGEKSPFPFERVMELDLPKDLHFVEMEKVL